MLPVVLFESLPRRQEMLNFSIINDTQDDLRQLWDKQVLLGQSFTNWDDLYHTLRRRRDFLNTRLPCASLGDVPPLVAYPEAHTAQRPYRPEWEVQLLDLSRVYAYLAKGRWFRKVSKDGTVSLGAQVYILGRAWARKRQQQVEYHFRPAQG